MSQPSPHTSALKEDSSEVEVFEAKLRCSLLLEDVDPFATVPVIRNALGQFGSVRNVHILKSPLDPKLAGKRAIVEMATPYEAAHAIKEIQELPFIMMKGVARPVIASSPVPGLFPERPHKLKKIRPASDVSTDVDRQQPKLSCVWVERGDPDWDMANQQKQLAKKHITESLYLMQELRKEEERLESEQRESAASYLNKFAIVENCIKDKTVEQLREYYGLRSNIK